MAGMEQTTDGEGPPGGGREPPCSPYGDPSAFCSRPQRKP